MHVYVEITLERAEPEARSWFEDVLAQLRVLAEHRHRDREDSGGKGDPRRTLLPAYTATRRRLGERLVELSRHQHAAATAAGVEPPSGWRDAELGRAALLVATLEVLPLDEHERLIHQIYTKGDNAERRALLRALPALPEPARFLDTAVEACRTHVVPIFEAIACDNDYPRRHFPDSAYNQLVMKALFLSIPLERVRGLEARAQPELVRMACDFAAERRAAGRPIPIDIARVPGWMAALCSARAKGGPGGSA